MSALSDLTAAATAADPACAGCAILAAQTAVQPGWLVVERVDGLRVRVDGVAPDSPSVGAVLALDLSDAATRARQVQRLATQSVMAVLSQAHAEPFAAGILGLLDVIFKLINDEREARGLARLAESDVVSLAIDALIKRQSSPT